MMASTMPATELEYGHSGLSGTLHHGSFSHPGQRCQALNHAPYKLKYIVHMLQAIKYVFLSVIPNERCLIDRTSWLHVLPSPTNQVKNPRQS